MLILKTPTSLNIIGKVQIMKVMREREEKTAFNFSYLCSSEPLSSSDGVYVSQIIRYASAYYALVIDCSNAYNQFFSRGNYVVAAGVSTVVFEGSISQILWSI